MIDEENKSMVVLVFDLFLVIAKIVLTVYLVYLAVSGGMGSIEKLLFLLILVTSLSLDFKIDGLK